MVSGLNDLSVVIPAKGGGKRARSLEAAGDSLTGGSLDFHRVVERAYRLYSAGAGHGLTDQQEIRPGRGNDAA